VVAEVLKYAQVARPLDRPQGRGENQNSPVGERSPAGKPATVALLYRGRFEMPAMFRLCQFDCTPAAGPRKILAA